jgi:phosphatidylserine synthase
VAYTTHRREAVYFLLLCGLLDSLDGPIARKLDAQSRFGNIYDSMSDLMAFGVAPAATLWILGYLHPIPAAFYILCIQFRLTRFSAMPEGDTPEKFFQGISSPDAAYLGTLFGLIPFSNFNLGFTLAALLAVYPGKLMPKNGKVIKFFVAIATLVYFVKKY